MSELFASPPPKRVKYHECVVQLRRRGYLVYRAGDEKVQIGYLTLAGSIKSETISKRAVRQLWRKETGRA